MEKPNPRTRPPITSVLKVISDEKALVLFNNIVIPDNDNSGIISLKKLICLQGNTIPKSQVF